MTPLHIDLTHTTTLTQIASLFGGIGATQEGRHDDACTRARCRLIMELRRAGITDTRVLDAIERMPREQFVPADLPRPAYEDTALPIAQRADHQPAAHRGADDPGAAGRASATRCWRSAPAPATRRRCCRAWRGASTRSSAIARAAEGGRGALPRAAHPQHHRQVGDGAKGWPEQAPFDRIIVTAAADERAAGSARPARRRRRDGGAGRRGTWRSGSGASYQAPEGVHHEILADVRFVPLIGGALPEEEGRPPQAAQNG